MLRIFLVISLLNVYLLAEAQLVYQLTGARAAGMGGAAAPVTDVWALHYNIGALAGVQEATVAASFQSRLNIPELSTAAITFCTPLHTGVAGAGISRFGFGAYSLTEGSLGFAHQINFVSIGLQAGFVQAATKGFGSRTVPLLSFGGTAELIPKLRFGGFAYNITQSRLSPETGEYIPTLLRAGLQWQATELFLLVVETEKDVDYPASFKSGFEYRLRPFLALRSGFSTRPESLHGGIGFISGKLKIDYALQHHRHLGLLHHASFSLTLNDKK
ncbi:hypothetical protein [Cesiribacter sp. SM1]|uniref:hypothetical protein n=1 Tax=Cesiribacter sp. SM1 TaxID=2861196 RepID=UPI001CD455E1|nr:hypothetical protein [Cesiribacter sp. SM1]